MIYREHCYEKENKLLLLLLLSRVVIISARVKSAILPLVVIIPKMLDNKLAFNQ